MKTQNREERLEGHIKALLSILPVLPADAKKVIGMDNRHLLAVASARQELAMKAEMQAPVRVLSLEEERGEIIAWMASDETGISSMLMASISVGVVPANDQSFSWWSHPRDFGDRNRCIRLIHRCPFAFRGLDALANVSDDWAKQRRMILHEMPNATVVRLDDWMRAVDYQS